MIVYLILLFTLLPAIELAVLLEVGSKIGAGNTILIILATGVLGAYLARLQGFRVLQKIQKDLNRGIMPQAELIDGLMILAGGLVLLTPGFITDTLGFILLIPLTRSLIKKWITRKLQNAIARGQVVTFTPFHKSGGQYEDIDIS